MKNLVYFHAVKKCSFHTWFKIEGRKENLEIPTRKKKMSFLAIAVMLTIEQNA